MKKTMVTWREVGRVIARLSKMTKKGSEGGGLIERKETCVCRDLREKESGKGFGYVFVFVFVLVCVKERDRQRRRLSESSRTSSWKRPL